MGLEVGGYQDRPDWPKLGPSLLIASCLILAIRTAKRAPQFGENLSGVELDDEIAYSVHLANRVLSHLMAKTASIFPQKKEPWFTANDEDVPK
jgi:hypothetical protein